jgi:transcriptional regulator with XRE-family HTH domain
MNTHNEVNISVLRIWLADRPKRTKARAELCSTAGVSLSLLTKMLRGEAPKIPELRYRICKAMGVKEKILFPTHVPLDAS